MYSTLSFRLTKEQYDYLIPVLREKLLFINNGITFKDKTKKDLYAFMGTSEDFADVLNRCKFLDEELLETSSDYTERFNYNRKYNSGLGYKQIHH